MRNLLHPFAMVAAMLSAVAILATAIAADIHRERLLLKVDLMLDHVLIDGPDDNTDEDAYP